MSIELPKLPEPAAWSCADYDIRPRLFLRESEARKHFSELEKLGGRPVPFEGNATPLYRESQVTALLQEAARLALEAAAKVCEKISVDHRDAYKGRIEPIDRDKLYNPHTDGCSDGAFDCAEAIRALASPGAGKGAT